MSPSMPRRSMPKQRFASPSMSNLSNTCWSRPSSPSTLLYKHLPLQPGAGHAEPNCTEPRSALVYLFVMKPANAPEQVLALTLRLYNDTIHTVPPLGTTTTTHLAHLGFYIDTIHTVPPLGTTTHLAHLRLYNGSLPVNSSDARAALAHCGVDGLPQVANQMSDHVAELAVLELSVDVQIE
mmetsp:Transcript_4846/g.7937  ORF Transcript_4846/g.7937 Transcript_4846/m.7937 type:complete len:181 (-) Transcript_4846:203-745(-)